MDSLSGVIRAYDWGDPTALADLLGHEPPGHPEAEYWLGTHPGGPGRLGECGEPFDEAIAARTSDLLGPRVAARFGGLPYLVKVLAARRALSIQAHPSAVQAEAGFQREERLGLDRLAPDRNYRDPNHKPELVCALTRFEARCGFRDPSVTDVVLEAFGPALAPVRTLLSQYGPAGTTDRLLRLLPADGAALAEATVEAARTAVARCAGGRLGAELRSTSAIGTEFPGDVGVVVALLLNHVVLEPGEALFLPAGNLHAYLGGLAVEVMASSDNVLRGGLTTKHIDVEELMSVVERRWGPVAVQRPSGPVHTYDTPVPEFEVTRVDGSTGSIGEPTFLSAGPEIVLVTGGAVDLVGHGGTIRLDRGRAAFIGAADGSYRVVDRGEGPVTAWRVAIGR